MFFVARVVVVVRTPALGQHNIFHVGFCDDWVIHLGLDWWVLVGHCSGMGQCVRKTSDVDGDRMGDSERW